MHCSELYDLLSGIHGVYVSCQYAVTIGDMIYLLCGAVANTQGVPNPMVGHLVPEKIIDTVCTFNPILSKWDIIYR